MRTILAATLLTMAIAAQAATEFTIEQLTTINGLVNNTVRYITQDSQGLMWFATSNGVSRYDGNTFTNLRPSRDKASEGLKDQRVTYIEEDSTGIVWLQTLGGISCYDLMALRFVTPPTPNHKRTGNVSHMEQTLTDAQGRTWRVTPDDGLYITGTDGQTEHYTTESKTCPLPTNALKCIFADADGTIWIGTDNLGVSRLTITQNEGAEYLLGGENIRTLTTMGNNMIAAANRNGEEWLYNGTLTKELGYTRHEHNTYCMTEGKGEHLWRGTKGGGLLVDSTRIELIPHDEIYSIITTSDTSMWVGTFGNGLVIYNPYRNAVTSHLLQHDFGSQRVRHLATDSKGRIWAATSNGLYAFSLPRSSAQQPKQIAHLCVAEGSLVSDEIRTVFVSSKGKVYIAEAGEGFAVWDNGHTTHYTLADGLVNDMVQCFLEDRQGFIWIATELGISRFNPMTKRFKNYFFSTNMLSNVFNENSGAMLTDGRIAFGSNNGIVIIRPSAYNANEMASGVSIDDIAINGRPVRHDTRYIIASWRHSPWARAAMALLTLVATATVCIIRRRHVRMKNTISALNTKKSELAKEAISLTKEKDELEAQTQVLCEEKAKLTGDIIIERNEQQTAEERAFIDQLEQTANNHMANPNFTADEFAMQMGMGRTVFFKKMKSLTGFSPAGYIRSRRIHRAAHLISTTSLTIAEIATKVGINDALYLSRIFKAEYKCSPTEWRKQASQTQK